MNEGRRIGCLLVPDLLIQAELRAQPEWVGHPLAVVSGRSDRAEVIAVSAEAARANVRAGQRVSHARAACRGLLVCTASPARERTARQSLLDAALSMSPRAELATPAPPPFAAEAAAFLDAAGVDALFDSERGFASALLARSTAIGLEAVVGIASCRFAAQSLARRLATPGSRASLRTLSPTEETDAIAALPIDLLAPDDALANRLTRFGVHHVRDLLALPHRSLSSRLGPEAVRLAALARGQGTEPPLPTLRPSWLEEASDLDHPIGELEPLTFLLRATLSRLFERLEIRSLRARKLDLVLELEGGGSDARSTTLNAPSLDLRVWLRALTLELQTRPPEAAVIGLSTRTEGQPSRQDQLDLFRPSGPSSVELDRALAELETLCGRESVGAPKLTDSHRPDRFEQSRFEPHQPQKTQPTPRDPAEAANTLAVRALRPPIRAEVHLQAGAPCSIRSALTSGEILHISGPWRTTGEWWSEEGRYALDHYDIQVSDGVIARLCFDWVQRCWRIDAFYD
jgi:protein ImuB